MSSSNGHDSTSAPRDAAPRKRRTPWGLAVVAAAFIVVPFLYWYGTWFGRELSDEQIEEYLREDENPRHAQHALSQIAKRIEERRPGAGRWNARVVALASSPVTDLRMTAAWVMGFEHGSEEFRAALARLLEDPQPVVRRNAALALVRFGDARARAELVAMLRPYGVVAPAEGKALTALPAGSTVQRESLLLKYRIGSQETNEIRAPLPGKVARASVKEGDEFRAGDELFAIAPDAEQVRSALVGLSYFGEADDLPEIENYARGAEGMTDEVKRQAALTADAVKRRAESKQ